MCMTNQTGGRTLEELKLYILRWVEPAAGGDATR